MALDSFVSSRLWCGGAVSEVCGSYFRPWEGSESVVGDPQYVYGAQDVMPAVYLYSYRSPEGVWCPVYLPMGEFSMEFCSFLVF